MKSLPWFKTSKLKRDTKSFTFKPFSRMAFLLFPAEGPDILGFRVQDASTSIIYEIFQFRNTFHAEDCRKILGKSRKRKHHRALRRDVSAKAPRCVQPIFRLRRKPNANHFRPGLRIEKFRPVTFCVVDL